ncbi:hypothetical protein [Actinoplanes sp. NPDC026619]|uniref:hypothetical protein n=1 Tax=Actinoplanes sp. NPDC026619 TaxID=3155798 RepID=UPI0033C6BD0B
MTLDTEPDLSVFVLNQLDDHLSAMLQIRERLRPGGRITPGGRMAIAVESITLAEDYAASLTRALGDDGRF